ncbi:hypothetical protein [Nocardia cyriacigeorgica]|uniref:hypothetical protein n=1 Tax=Nocardia cyriacigeorgica TaxID=135487 RepID=UPI003514E9CF
MGNKEFGVTRDEHTRACRPAPVPWPVMEWPWEKVRRRADERKLSHALIAADMAENGHADVVPALVASLMHRPFRARRSFPDTATALDAIWGEALSLPRWQHAQTTRENARKRLSESELYRHTVDGRRKLRWSDRRYLAGLATRSEQNGDHAVAAAIRDLENGPRT